MAGQYLGFALLVAVSLLGVLGALVAPREYIGFLGVLPIVLGVLAWARQGDDEDEGVLERVMGTARGPSSGQPPCQSRPTRGRQLRWALQWALALTCTSS